MYPLGPLLEGNFSFIPKQFFQHFLAVYDCFMNSEFVICCSVWITLSFIFFLFQSRAETPKWMGEMGSAPQAKCQVGSVFTLFVSWEIEKSVLFSTVLFLCNVQVISL